MPWFKVDDKLHGHKKVAKAGIPAMGLWCVAGSWCADHLSDGFVPNYIVARLAGSDGDDLAARLVAVEMWQTGNHDGDEGWWFKDWDEYQPTREDVVERREYEREKKRRQRRGPNGQFTRSRRESPGESRGVSPGDKAGSPDGSPTVPTRPDPYPNQTPSSAAPTPKPEKPKRTPPNADLFEALCEVSRLDPKQLTRTAASGIGKCAKELAELGVSGDEVRQVARRYRREWPQAELTPHALAKHWGRFAIGQARQPDPDACGTCGFGPSEHDDLFCKQLQREVG